MKKFILSTVVMVSFGFYVIWQSIINSSASLTAIPNPVVAVNNTKNTAKTVETKQVAVVDNTTPTPISKPTPVPTPTPTPAPTPVVIPPPPKKTGLYTDGVYTGASVDAYYGNVQVQVTISGGKIADVQFLNYPQDRSTSIQINSRAMPILIQEAISAQSAQVNGASGASETSAAFIQSLTSALNAAKA